MKISNLLTPKPYLLTTWSLATLALLGSGIRRTCKAQAPAIPKNYICYTTPTALQIDGKLNEKSWQKAEWTDLFLDIEGLRQPLPLQRTKAKMLWDQNYLYIGADIEEEHIWAYQDKKDQIVYLENDFEVFIDPDGDTHQYYELEINAINNSFDLYLPKPYRNGGHPQLDWNINGLESAVSIEGTLNNNTDRDKKWTLEIAIPLKSLSTQDAPAIIPSDGSLWRINFSRVNWQTDYIDGKYVRRKNKDTGKNLPEYNWVWSPQGVINMHVPEKWGYLQFSTIPVGKKKLTFDLPYEERMKIMARDVYELQLKFRHQHKRFASSMEELLNGKSGLVNSSPSETLEAGADTELVTISNQQKNIKVTVNKEGKTSVSPISKP